MKSWKVRTVKANDTLPAIAAEMYGDPRQWRRIAEANEIDDPLGFPKEGAEGDVGRVLQVPL